MTNSKNTKRALLSSVLALLVCVTMLIGTTFAWFTDSVTSGGNKIVSGNLDIDLYLWNDATNSVEITSESAPIFGSAGLAQNSTNTLWEPGKTQVVYLSLKNNGSLDLKYKVGVDVKNPVGGKDLYKAMQYDIIENAKFDSVAAWTSGVDVVEGINTTQANDVVLGAGDEHFFALAIHMKESAGNEYQNGQVNFDIRVLATQLASESDSFGNQYDAGATYGTYIELEAGEDLLAAMASAEADMPLTIKLNGNVEWPTEGHHGENDITKASSIVIDGNGHTITATGAGVTPLGDTEAPMTLKNVKIVDNSVSYNESAWELSYLEMGGKVLNCVNVDFADPITIDGENSTFTNCSFVGHYDKNSTSTTQYGVWVSNGNANFIGCTFTGTRGLKICDQYAPEVDTVVVDGCTFNGISEKPGVVIDNRGEGDVSSTEGMTVIIKNSTFINCKAGDQGLYIYETDNIVPALENNTVLNNATIVSNKDELLAFSAKTLTANNNVAEEATIVLNANIDMKNAEFSAIIAQRGDKLNIVGNGYKISNVKVVSGVNDNTTGQASMFYAYPNSTLTISDLILENITVTADANSSGYAAAVVGYCEGAAVFNNVDVVNANVTGVKSSGMLVGHLSGSLVATNCDLSGTVTLADFAEEANGHYAAKYIGTLAGPATLTNCTANVTVSGNLNAANIGDVYGRKTAAGSLN